MTIIIQLPGNILFLIHLFEIIILFYLIFIIFGLIKNCTKNSFFKKQKINGVFGAHKKG